MSHNTLQIGAAAQDRDGDLLPNLGDLSDVTIASLADNDVLAYATATSDWRNSAASIDNPEYSYLWNVLTAGTYGVGSSEYSVAGIYPQFWWRNGGVANPPLVDASVAPVTAGVNWTTGVTVPAGTYLFMIQPMSKASAIENITWQWHDGTSFVGPKIYHQPSTAKGGAVSTTVYTAAGSTSLELRVVAVTGTPGFQDANNDNLIGIHITEL
ncbi:MAG: hypothetical protein ACYSTZ_10015 [Planctomycetota bacterium]|jgi:hypothetical protein